jgi:hypothetical protein
MFEGAMTNYYFLITAFPPLKVGIPPEMTFKELRDLIELNIVEKDRKYLEELLRPIDLYNIHAKLLGMPFDERGTMKAAEIEEDLLIQEGLSSYVIDYFAKYESFEERLRWFSSLYASFYKEAMQSSSPFLLKYFQFERELRLILTALRAKFAKKNIVRELQFEDPYDPLVLEILSQKDMNDFQVPKEYEDLKNLFLENVWEPKKLERAILEYRLEKIEEMDEPQDFGIDRVLAYVAKFLIVESFSSLDKEKGMEQLKSYE